MTIKTLGFCNTSLDVYNHTHDEILRWKQLSKIYHQLYTVVPPAGIESTALLPLRQRTGIAQA